MHVLHVYRTFFPDTQGGIEEVIRQICKNTAIEGIENRVFCLSHAPTPAIVTVDGIQVYRVKNHLEIASCGLSWSALSTFNALVEWADLIHYQFPWPFADILHGLARVKKPSIVTYESDIIRQQSGLILYRPLMKWFLSQMHTIIATSPQYAQTSDVLQQHAPKVEVIPIGIDETSYPMAKQDTVARMRQRVGSGFFLFIGVLRYYKGLHVLLDALHNTDLPVIIVGKGAEELALKAQAKALKLTHVHFLGRVSNDDKFALLQLALAMVFPSHVRSEAFGVTLLESAMYAKPMISCELGTGTSFVNQDQETGIVVPPNHPQKLQDAMNLFINNETLARGYGKAARRRYERLFTGKKMGMSYTTLYKKVLSMTNNKSFTHTI